MKFFCIKVTGICLLMSVLFLSGFVMAGEHVKDDPPSDANTEIILGNPDIADIIPLSGKLSGSLTVLKNQISRLPNVDIVEKQYEEIGLDLKKLSNQLKELKESKEYRFNKIEELKGLIKNKTESITKISKPLNQSIRQLENWRKDWQKEKSQWNQWQIIINKENAPYQLKSAFQKAKTAIDTAIKLIISKLSVRMSVQEKSAEIESKIVEFSADLGEMLSNRKREVIFNASPPMFSNEYFSQFSGDLWFAIAKGLHQLIIPDDDFSEQRGWVIFSQLIFSFFTGFIFYRRKQFLKTSEHWCFLADRPFAAGFFLISITMMLIFEYWIIPDLWKLSNNLVVGISFIRLSAGLIKIPWRRQFVIWLITFLLVIHLCYFINCPLPIFRLCTTLGSLFGITFCLYWAKESRHNKESAFYSSLMLLGAFFFVIILLAEFFGIVALPLFLFVSLIESIATGLVFFLFLYMIHGGVEWFFRRSPLKKSGWFKSEEIDVINLRVVHLIDFVVWGLVFIPAVLMIWGVYDNLSDATRGFFSIGFKFGDQLISLGLLIFSIGIIYITFLFSWITQILLMNLVLIGRILDKGARFSITRLVHYVIICIGFLIAISSLGLDITKLTIIISALGVGIGFGMQGIVNNFISGLILLFERPIRVGDTIEIEGKWSEIKKIGLRATTVQTLEQANVIIPNADLISNNVTNWTLGNRQIRATISVGVAYGSDVSLVMETLIECATNNKKVTQRTLPQVLFLGFGESSLDFELRVWILDADYRMIVKSELNQDIDRRFREANIEIAFPQRDLHLRSVDESTVFRQTISG